MSLAAVGVAVAGTVAGAVVSSALAPSPGANSAASAAADPFAAQRPQYQTMLNQLMTDPSSVSQDPGYQFQFQQGQQAVNAGEAASGNLNSGNRALALQSYGQQEASTEYSNDFNRLAQLSGANIGSPAAAGQIIAGQNATQQAGASAIGNAVGTAVTGFGNSLNSGSSAAGAVTSGNNSYGFSTTPGATAPGYGFSSGVSQDPSYGVSYGV